MPRGTVPSQVLLLYPHGERTLLGPLSQAVLSSLHLPLPPALLLTFFYSLPFFFPPCFGLGQPFAALFLVLTWEHQLVSPSFLLSLPGMPDDFPAGMFVQGRREHCVLRFNPLHFPEVLGSSAHVLLILSRLVCLVQTAASLELGLPPCLGEAYCFTVRPSDSCYLRPETQNCQRRVPEAGMSCSSARPPRSQLPLPSGTTPGRRPV